MQLYCNYKFFHHFVFLVPSINYVFCIKKATQKNNFRIKWLLLNKFLALPAKFQNIIGANKVLLSAISRQRVHIGKAI